MSHEQLYRSVCAAETRGIVFVDTNGHLPAWRTERYRVVIGVWEGPNKDSIANS